jgi:hypothetical protein
MTVVNTNYSYLEEAWPELDKPKKTKTKKREQKEAQCDSFAKSMAKFDDIMDVYAQPPNSEYYNKIPFSRTQDHLPETDAEDRESVRHVQIPKVPKEVLDHYYEEPQIPKEIFVQSDDKIHLDFGMYLFSGVLLIFIMEQFVQIGLNMRR